MGHHQLLEPSFHSSKAVELTEKGKHTRLRLLQAYHANIADYKLALEAYQLNNKLIPYSLDQQQQDTSDFYDIRTLPSFILSKKIDLKSVKKLEIQYNEKKSVPYENERFKSLKSIEQFNFAEYCRFTHQLEKWEDFLSYLVGPQTNNWERQVCGFSQ